MPIVLPKERRVDPLRVDPRILIIYGEKKVGKTDELTKLDSCLILDGEEGTATHTNVLAVSINSMKDIKDLRKAVEEEGAARAKAGKKGLDLFPYRYMAIDTLDSIEAIIEPTLTMRYKESVKGKTFTGSSILELDHGLGYYFLREGIKEVIKDVAAICPYVILVSHLKEKEDDKGGITTTSKDISLTGKLGGIVAAMADAIGYMYRKPGKPGEMDKMFISFKTTEGITMGARCPHLRGQTFEFDWSRIYTEDPALKK